MLQDMIQARRLAGRMYRRFYPRLFVACLSLVLLLSCIESTSQAEDSVAASTGGETASTPVSVPVRVARVTDTGGGNTLRFAGVTRPLQRANLSFQVGGVIETRFAEIGQQVQVNEVVARLYNPQLEPAMAAAAARMEQLEADAEQAGRDLVRLERLYERGLLAIQDVEQQRTVLKSTRAAIDNARANLVQSQQLQEESELRAPFTGHIEEVLLESGEFAQPGQIVLRMSAEAGLEVEVRVPPRFLSSLALGDVLPVWNSLTGVEYQGRITEIGEASSGTRALYPLVVSLEDGLESGSGNAGENLRNTRLRSGEALEVGVNTVRNSELSIPLNAVMRSAGGLTVFKVEAGRVRRVPVSVSQITGDRVLLAAESASLQRGDQVVYAGLTRLADGDRIEILENTGGESSRTESISPTGDAP